MSDLWPHQKKMLDQIEAAWATGYRSVCGQIPTGGGKTRIIRVVTERFLNEGAMLIAHRESLVDQLSAEILSAGLRHGLIKSGHPYIAYKTQVCSVQTLCRRLDKIKKPGVLIFDEYHHARAKTWTKIINHWPDVKILGMTATPGRPDGKGLDLVADILLTGPSVKYLIKNNYLSDYEYFAPDIMDMSGVKKSRGDFAANQSLAMVDRAIITGSAVEHYRKYADGLPAIASCVSIAHAEHVAAEFLSAGYPTRAVHSKMSSDYIRKSIEGLRDGSVKILCQVDLLGEGVDIKHASCLIFLRPTDSVVIFLQHIGRVLRYAPGKKAIILDHVNNWERHGLPDDDRQWSLAGCKTQQTSQYKRCPGCFIPVAKSERQCPGCGFLWAENKDKKSRMPLPTQKKGQLINVTDIKRQNLTVKIAREARSLKQAISIAKKSGATHRQAYYIWSKILKMRP